MSAGSVLYTDGGKRSLIRWVAGPMIKSFWFGIQMKGRKPIDIQSFRCNRCGFVELYAPEA